MIELLVQSVCVGLIGVGLGYMMAVLDGPFGLASALRTLMQKPFMPWWVIEGADCPFCWAFSFCLLGALLVAPGLFLAAVVKPWLIGYGFAVFMFKHVGL